MLKINILYLYAKHVQTMKIDLIVREKSHYYLCQMTWFETLMILHQRKKTFTIKLYRGIYL